MAELYESWQAAQGEEDLTELTELLIREAVGKHLKTLGKSGREADEADFEEVIAIARRIGLLR